MFGESFRQEGAVVEWTKSQTTGVLGLVPALDSITKLQFSSPNMVIIPDTCYEVPCGITGLS